MINEGSRHDSNEFLNDIARDRYLLAVPSTALIRLRNHIDEIFNAPNSVEQNEKIVLDLQIMVAALQELSTSAFSSRELKFLNNEIRPELLQKIKQIRNSYRNVENIELLDRLLDLITKLNPDKTASLFNLDYDAIARRLIKPAGLALAASLALAQGRNDDQKQDKTTPIEEVKMIPITPNFVVKEDEPTLDKRGKFVQKIIKALKNGTFEFSAYFDELEADFEDVSAQEMQLGKSKNISILENIIKKYLSLPDLEYMQEVSNFAKSPADDLDNRNSRASSNELLADTDTIGNCEARARTTYRLIEKTRPGILKHISIIKWKKHEAIGYTADDGTVYQFDAGRMTKIPGSWIKKIIRLTPQQAWVDPLIYPSVNNSETRFDHEDTNTAINFDSSDAPEMPKEFNVVKKNRSTKEGEEPKFPSEVLDNDVPIADQFSIGIDRKNNSEDPKTLTVNINEMAISNNSVYVELKKISSFHHVTHFSYYFDNEDGKTETVDDAGDGTVQFNPKLLIDGIKKMDLAELVFSSKGSGPLLLSDFNIFKNIKHAVISSSNIDNAAIVSFLNNLHLTRLSINTHMLTDEVIEALLKQDQLRLLEVDSLYGFDSRITSPTQLSFKKMTELRKRGFTVLLKDVMKSISATPEMIKAYREDYKEFLKVNGKKPFIGRKAWFWYDIDAQSIDEMMGEISKLDHDLSTKGLIFSINIPSDKLSPIAVEKLSRFIFDYQNKIRFHLNVTAENAQNESLFNFFEACTQATNCRVLTRSDRDGTSYDIEKLPHWKNGGDAKGPIFVK